MKLDEAIKIAEKRVKLDENVLKTTTAYQGQKASQADYKRFIRCNLAALKTVLAAAKKQQRQQIKAVILEPPEVGE